MNGRHVDFYTFSHDEVCRLLAKGARAQGAMIPEHAELQLRYQPPDKEKGKVAKFVVEVTTTQIMEPGSASTEQA